MRITSVQYLYLAVWYLCGILILKITDTETKEPEEARSISYKKSVSWDCILELFSSPVT